MARVDVEIAITYKGVYDMEEFDQDLRELDDEEIIDLFLERLVEDDKDARASVEFFDVRNDADDYEAADDVADSAEDFDYEAIDYWPEKHF